MLNVTSRRSILSLVLFTFSTILMQAGTVPVYEYYSSGFHFYTTSALEGAASGYGYNGVAYTASDNQTSSMMYPLYRYSSPHTGFLYTTDWNELNSGGHGYTYNGVQCYVSLIPQMGKVPLYRFRNVYNGNHFYTISPGQIFGYQYITEANPDYDEYSDWDYDGYDDEGDYMYIYTPTNTPNLSNSAYAYEGITCYVWQP